MHLLSPVTDNCPASSAEGGGDRMTVEMISWSISKRGSSVVSALASRARGTGIDPRHRQGNFGVRKRFLRVICRGDMKTGRPPSDRDVNWRSPMQAKLSPVQVNEPYGNSKWLLVGLHPVARSVQCTPSVSSYPASILRKSISGRHRPVSYPDGPMTARYRFT